ncbi:hypothetical protein [Streptomyces sp. PT12]|uniref:GntT/GntP/DsdX family permease n=1 Tax=Streptomyces sp. PT12 TaxID=1510197 RepID=UPI00215C300C|nr:hypothetical protein [Streptomyces sp. PT12]
MVAAFIIAGAPRVAQGSATVALTTAAGLVQPLVDGGDFSSVAVAALVLALAAGSVIASHVNDSGFWLVGRLMETDVKTTLKTTFKTTLKTWTVMQSTIPLRGFALASPLYAAA